MDAIKKDAIKMDAIKMDVQRAAIRQEPTRKDPALIEQLDEAAAGANLVEAIFMLRPDDPSLIAVDPERTEEVAHQVIERVQAEVGVEAKQINIFRNLGSFIVAAPARFVRRMMEQPEIASAMANRQPQTAFVATRGRKSRCPKNTFTE